MSSQELAPSPPRGTIIYSEQVNKDEYTHDNGSYNLFLVRPPNLGAMRLTHHAHGQHKSLGGAIKGPKISPNGNLVLFRSNYANVSRELLTTLTDSAPHEDAMRNIWLFDLPNQKLRAVTVGDWGWSNVSWSPDGKRFAATYPVGLYSVGEIYPDDIFVFDAASLKKRKLLRASGQVTSLSWSNDGLTLMYQVRSSPYLHSVIVSSGQLKLYSVGKGRTSSYSMSPNGRSIAFIGGYDSEDRSKGGNCLYIEDTRSKKFALLLSAKRDDGFSYSGVNAHHPKWSHNSRFIALSEYGYGERKARIHVIDTHSSQTRILTTFTKYVDVFNWSRDGQWLIVASASSGEVYAVSVKDGRAVTLMSAISKPNGLDWYEAAPP